MALTKRSGRLGAHDTEKRCQLELDSLDVLGVPSGIVKAEVVHVGLLKSAGSAPTPSGKEFHPQSRVRSASSLHSITSPGSASSPRPARASSTARWIAVPERFAFGNVIP